MSALRRAAIRRLVASAYEMELETMTGILTKDADGHWRIGTRTLDQWLEQHAGEEISLVLGSLADERPIAVRTCRTCGRDYTEPECPHCRSNRLRLRGRA